MSNQRARREMKLENLSAPVENLSPEQSEQIQGGGINIGNTFSTSGSVRGGGGGNPPSSPQPPAEGGLGGPRTPPSNPTSPVHFPQ